MNSKLEFQRKAVTEKYTYSNLYTFISIVEFMTVLKGDFFVQRYKYD